MTGLPAISSRAWRRIGAPLFARSHRDQPAVILMYHRVSDEPRSGLLDWDGKRVPGALFRTQLRWLARCRRILPLGDLVQRMRSGADTAGMAAITFDDGYADNAEVAAPILRELGVPAAFFLATGYIDAQRWMWQDRLEYALHRTARRALFVTLLGEQVALDSLAQRWELVRRVKRALKTVPWQIAEREVQQLERELEVAPEPPPPFYRFMGWNDVKRLAQDGFEIGPHTINHTILSRVPVDEMEREILGSRADITARIGAGSSVFCYPNGQPADYSEDTQAICRRHFDAALAANAGVASASLLYALPRVAIDRASRPWRFRREILRDR